MIKLTVNAQPKDVQSLPETPLLWVLRDELDLKATKFGCGIAQCGACTVHADGRPLRSCVISLEQAAGLSITTLEGLDSKEGEALKRAWVELQVPQCGYCQSGQIMQAAALLKENPEPTDEEIVAAMNGNLCRCMTYIRIRKAIRHASAKLGSDR